ITVDAVRIVPGWQWTCRVVSAVEIYCIVADRNAQAVQIEMGVARLHRIPGPLNKISSFLNCAVTLAPLQLGAHPPVLKIRVDRHHMGVTKNLRVTDRG